MSPTGTNRTSGDVRAAVAIGRKADIEQARPGKLDLEFTRLTGAADVLVPARYRACTR